MWIIICLEIDGCESNPCIHGECFTSGPSQGAIVDDTELEVGQLPNDVESLEQPSFGHLPTHEINQLARTLGIDSRKLQDLLAKRGNHLSGRRAVRSTDHVAQQPGWDSLLYKKIFQMVLEHLKL